MLVALLMGIHGGEYFDERTAGGTRHIRWISMRSQNIEADATGLVPEIVDWHQLQLPVLKCTLSDKGVL